MDPLNNRLFLSILNDEKHQALFTYIYIYSIDDGKTIKCGKSDDFSKYGYPGIQLYCYLATYDIIKNFTYLEIKEYLQDNKIDDIQATIDAIYDIHHRMIDTCITTIKKS